MSDAAAVAAAGVVEERRGGPLRALVRPLLSAPATLSRSPPRAAAVLARPGLCRIAACAARAELFPARRFHRPDRLQADAGDLRRASGAVQSRHHPAHRCDGGARHDRVGDHRVPHRLFRCPLRARALEGLLLSRDHAAALVELSGPRLRLEAHPRKGRHPHLALRQAAPLLAARRAARDPGDRRAVAFDQLHRHVSRLPLHLAAVHDPAGAGGARARAGEPRWRPPPISAPAPARPSGT